eukprot:10575518-Karenia_brevis.AAC.1
MATQGKTIKNYTLLATPDASRFILAATPPTGITGVGPDFLKLCQVDKHVFRILERGPGAFGCWHTRLPSTKTTVGAK